MPGALGDGLGTSVIPGITDIAGLAQAIRIVLSEGERAETDAETVAAVDVSLGHLAALAAIPSRTVEEIALKVEVLVSRLLGGGVEDMLETEAAILRSIAQDLRRVIEVERQG